MADVSRRRRQGRRWDRFQSVRGGFAGREVDAHLAAQCLAERVDEGDLVGGRDVGAAAAAVDQPATRADHRDPAQLAALDRQRGAFVLEQDEASAGGLAVERAVLECVGGFRALACVFVEMEGGDGAQLPPHQFVEDGRLDLLVGERGADGGPGVKFGFGHFQVEAGAHGRHHAVGGGPVGHDQPAETPLPPQALVEQARVLASVDAVHLVVGTHHGPHRGLLDRGLEGGQVDLVQRACIDLGADGLALGLLVVHREVLDRGDDTLALYALDVSHGHARGELGILAEVFEVAAVERRANDVDRGSEEHVLAVRLRLARDGRADPRRELGSEGRGEQGAGGKGRGLANPHPDGAVGHAQGRDVQPRHADRVEAGARHERDLLVERHRRQPGLDLTIFRGLARGRRRRGARCGRRGRRGQRRSGPLRHSDRNAGRASGQDKGSKGLAEVPGHGSLSLGDASLSRRRAGPVSPR